jgi:hypothetical protein
MAKVLLLNPPGDRLYLRDSYCSKVSKAAYLTPPMDLLAISGYLEGGHEIRALDAMAGRLSFQAALERVAEIGPDLIVSLVGQASLANDLGFFARLKAGFPRARLIVSGDAGFDDTEKLLRENRSIDAVLLDYVSRRWLPYMEKAYDKAADIAFLDGGRYRARRSAPAREYSIGLPRHGLFPYRKYRMPFARALPYAGVATDFGCPFKCGFCLTGRLPYKLRPVAEVVGELEYLKKLGIRYFSFGDQTFGADRQRTENLLSAMIGKGLDLPWACFARADLLDEPAVKLMRRAGCDLAMIGVESGDQGLLDRYGKGLTIGRIREAFALCRRLGIRTVATFILGLPGEIRETAERTVRLALELDPDFASFNAAVAKPLTPLAAEARLRGWLRPGPADQSGSSNLATGNAGPEAVEAWVKKAARRFYLRPGYLMRRLMSMSSFTELGINLAEAAALLRGGTRP